MKRVFRSRLEEAGWFTWLAIGAVIVIALLVVVFAVVRPAILQIERQSVESSKSYTDSSNIALTNYIVQYNSPNATEGQQKAIIGAMCEMTAKMASGTVSPQVTKFLAGHGGCE